MNTSKSAYPSEGFHWTLLVLNYKKKTFQHYNSMKPRKGSVDKFYEEAGILKNEVVNCIDQYRAKRKLPKISWPIQIGTPSCPQQGNTADCGLYVCRIIEALSSGDKLPTSKDCQSNVDELKPTLTGQILGDKEHSWDFDKECK
ncbi:hypothetical protein FRX31_015303 [Thalictrum thalictroides]|uniref:Ubiquitin-like protease family profile domain-containing protein n=1 Tax=Thalictrum thalictroides TaxID=46969 RepID=A0A7J6WCK7_THATH|nr:hypothetical protein FRX31_015303 [Thalictrum thalictroides]